MEINLTDTGKRYNREWIFRHVDYRFTAGNSYAIIGPNGSGKSTLLQVIAGAVMHTEGKIDYSINHTSLAAMAAYKHIAISAPYLELIEEMTATELLKFHATFKQLSSPITEILENVNLGKAAHKQIRYFSSGMKQRLKLAQAFFSDTPVLLLDEPTSNLDEEGIEIYQQLIQHRKTNRMIIISSNDKYEYSFCGHIISIASYK